MCFCHITVLISSKLDNLSTVDFLLQDIFGDQHVSFFASVIPSRFLLPRSMTDICVSHVVRIYYINWRKDVISLSVHEC